MTNHHLQVLVPESLHKRVREAARRSNVSIAMWVRQAIRERLERESRGLPDDPLAALRKLDAPTADIGDMIAQIASGRS